MVQQWRNTVHIDLLSWHTDGRFWVAMETALADQCCHPFSLCLFLRLPVVIFNAEGK